MKKIAGILSIALIAVMLAAVLTACGGGSADGGSKDAIAGSWKQIDEVNGNWTWTFDGSGKCTLDGETTGFKSNGTYKLDEAAKTVTVNMESWTDEKVYTYTLTDTTLDLEETLSSYHLVKQ